MDKFLDEICVKFHENLLGGLGITCWEKTRIIKFNTFHPQMSYSNVNFYYRLTLIYTDTYVPVWPLKVASAVSWDWRKDNKKLSALKILSRNILPLQNEQRVLFLRHIKRRQLRHKNVKTYVLCQWKCLQSVRKVSRSFFSRKFYQQFTATVPGLNVIPKKIFCHKKTCSLFGT
jgi:hypothetical protein